MKHPTGLHRASLGALLAVGLALALVAVGWLDYVSARREFGTLVRAHATSVRDTIAAAARANRAAADEARAELAERLLDNARLLAELDRVRLLSPAFLADVAHRNHLFRLTVLAPDGTREHFAGAPAAGPGRGQGGPGWGAGLGMGAGPDASAMIDRLITGGEPEAVSDIHAGRRGGVARLAAGVRRSQGGAIVISVDASDVFSLQRQESLDRLLEDIVRHTGDVAYVVFEQGDIRRARGETPPDTPGTAHSEQEAFEREVRVAGRPVLELTGPIDLGGGTGAHVHLGMRLDDLRRAERRTLVRLVTSLTAATLLGALALGLLWLRERYGTLSVEHARAQEALRRRDRLAAMGELASTVAHEIRNPLNAIAMSAQRLRRECFDGTGTVATEHGEAVGLVGVIQGEAQRINQKVQQFLEYARPPALAPHPVALRAWIDATAESIAPMAAARRVALERHADDAQVVVDPEQLRQALDNLLRNAIEATPPDGTVGLDARVSLQGLAIAVSDTGPGISPERVSKIFDLYYTTKPDGTGVGLAVSQQIVAAHGGRIDVESSPGRGTTMRVVIPRPSHA